MDYEEIGEIVGNIKFHYVETGEWNSPMCGKLMNLTQHVPLMVGRKRGISYDDLPDIVQQSYQAAFGYLDRLGDDRSFPKYLYTIADNLCRKYWKNKIKTGYQTELEFSDGHPVTQLPNTEQFNQAVLREDLRDAVNQLPDIYKEAIELFYFAGLKAKEISLELNISINTVTSRVRRGRLLLKDFLEE